MSNVTIAIDCGGPLETNIMTAINVECLWNFTCLFLYYGSNREIQVAYSMPFIASWMRRYNAACSQCFKFRLHDLWYCKPTNIVPFFPTLKLQYYDFNNCWMLWTCTCIFCYSKSDHEIIVYLLSFIASLKLCQRFKLCLHGRWNCKPKNMVLVMVVCWCFIPSYEC